MVKGNINDLTADNRAFFIQLEENSYGFTGITKDIDLLKKELPKAIFERVNIEDLMIAYIGGGKAHA